MANPSTQFIRWTDGTFSSNLWALRCREDVRKDPIFRARFHTMCANVGVDPLASNKGVWAQLMGFGDFYYQLGVQIVEACLATRPYNGGLMDLESLREFIMVCAPPTVGPALCVPVD